MDIPPCNCEQHPQSAVRFNDRTVLICSACGKLDTVHHDDMHAAKVDDTSIKAELIVAACAAAGAGLFAACLIVWRLL